MQNKKIHFIGIGGIGVSGLARLYLHEGAMVSGSDIAESDNTRRLSEEGADVVYEQTAGNISSRSHLELVVYTEAMAADHPELVAARAAGIRTINYFEALGEIANDYYLIAVAGTHGKTTTTAMLVDILEEASYDPSAIVGSLRTKTGSNYRAGKSKYFVVEACEYKRDFLTLQPDVLVITNLEHEHVDYYQDLADVQSAFAELAERVPADGYIIAPAKDVQVSPVLADVSAEVIDYQKHIDLSLRLPQPGLYTQLNAAAASAAATAVGVEQSFVTTALENFAGTKRRFEYKGLCNNAPVYDDYAHHPTEIKAAIAGVREKYPDRKLTVIFQPHTYSRTVELQTEFVAALQQADRVVLVPIYAAREVDTGAISSAMLAEQVGGTHFETLPAAAQSVKEQVGTDDVVVVMGAGDITQVADQMVS